MDRDSWMRVLMLAVVIVFALGAAVALLTPPPTSIIQY